jgi:hypothetical protein
LEKAQQAATGYEAVVNRREEKRREGKGKKREEKGKKREEKNREEKSREEKRRGLLPLPETEL